MGRPLYSTLIAPAEPVVRVVEVETPTYEKWSFVNAFNPDADEFFEGEDVVEERFLTPEEVAAREQAARDAAIDAALAARVTRMESLRNSMRLVHAQANAAAREAVNAMEEEARPGLSESSEDDSSTDGSASGQITPAEYAATVRAVLSRRLAIEIPTQAEELDDLPPLLPVPPRTHSMSLPASPVSVHGSRSLPFDGSLNDPYAMPSPSSPVSAAPLSLSMAQPLSPEAPVTPMTPPGTTTPRFLSWARPHAVDMSPSPTPNAPFGSVRASRMAVSFLAPPSGSPVPLSVHQ